MASAYRSIDAGLRLHSGRVRNPVASIPCRAQPYSITPAYGDDDDTSPVVASTTAVSDRGEGAGHGAAGDADRTHAGGDLAVRRGQVARARSPRRGQRSGQRVGAVDR